MRTIDQVVTEDEALELLTDAVSGRMTPTYQLLKELDDAEEIWVEQFDKLSNEARKGHLENQYKINYLCGLSILIPVLPTFRKILEDSQLVDEPNVQNETMWSDYNHGTGIDEWLK